jgi:hypothetical protein
MTRLAVTILAGLLLLAGARGARAADPTPGKKVACKEIKAAIASGKTPQQVAAELGVREKRVTACTSGRKKNKAERAAKQAAPAQPTPAQ